MRATERSRSVIRQMNVPDETMQIYRESIDRFLVGPEATVRSVMACIDSNTEGIALIVNDDRKLLGTVTDGDIRRGILGGLSLSEPVQELLGRKTSTRYAEPVTARSGCDPGQLLQKMHEHVVHQIPLLDGDGCVVDLVTMDDLMPQEFLPLQAVIMAGGFGTRLRPLTEDVPKPMLPLGNQPILERIIGQLKSVGVRQMNITTHYKPEIITDYFGDGKDFGVDINYVSEDSPMGTAGALGLIDCPDEPLLVINGDILTQVDFRAMLAYHREHEADLTVAVRQYDLQVPYGVLECDGFQVRGIKEKPTYNFFVNAGIYLLDPDAHQYIPPGRRFDMTDLIEHLIAADRTVASFPIVEYWLDIGQPDDYHQAQQDLQDGRIEH